MQQQAKAILSPAQIYLNLGSEGGPSASNLPDLDNLSISSAQSINTAQSSLGGFGLRICEPSDLDDNFRYGKKKDEAISVLSKIQRILPAGLDMGTVGGSGRYSCLGLLDPVSNITFNRLVAAGWPPGADEDTMDGGVRGDDEDWMDGGVHEDTLAHRSLDSLVAFLTCLFPYLPDGEALAYIDAAGADPLVAALLVIDRRKLTIASFITTASVEVALRSAAVAAKHQNSEVLVFIQGWKQASSLTPQKLVTWLRGHKMEWIDAAEPLLLHIRGSSVDDLQQLEDFWKLAQDRLQLLTLRGLKVERLPSARGALKRMLLSIIHGYYLKVLAILPKRELTERYHQSLLIGGHCYGPLDPVSNIIINTIWYDQTSPPVPRVQLKAMISTNCLWRIASCSLYGLVSFLCNRNKRLTPDQALHDLLVARANLRFADPAQLTDFPSKGSRKYRPATVLVAYIAAARSAQHPSPGPQAEFLGVERSVHHLRAFSESLFPEAWDGCTLNKDVLDCLIMLLRTPSSVGMTCAQQGGHEPIQLRQQVYLEVCEAKNSFWLRDERIGRMVEAALRKFNKPGVPEYRLHIICGVNELVEREFSLDGEDRPYNPWSPYKYHYSHINFLATCEGSPAPMLFFAECSNHGTDTAWCVPVPLHPDDGISLEASSVGLRPEAARCIYCEHEMSRIIHPITNKFCGRDDFKKLDGGYYSNNKLLSCRGYMVDWVENVEDDVIYS